MLFSGGKFTVDSPSWWVSDFFSIYVSRDSNYSNTIVEGDNDIVS